LEAALAADKLCGSAGLLGQGKDDCITIDDQQDVFGSIACELFTQSFALYEERVMNDSRIQCQCLTSVIGTLLACRSLQKEDYEGLIMKTSKYAAKMTKKSEQCEMVTRCSHLFYNVAEGDDGSNRVVYANPQRCLECLQRSLKLADACMNDNPSNLGLFVDLLDIYLYFFEKNNPSITGNYITGLVALVKEHANSNNYAGHQFAGGPVPVDNAKAHFVRIVRHIKAMKQKPDSSDQFKDVDVSSVET